VVEEGKLKEEKVLEEAAVVVEEVMGLGKVTALAGLLQVLEKVMAAETAQ